MLKVEVFSSPGCGKCTQAKNILEEVAKEFGQDKISWREVIMLDEINFAVELGVMSSPAIAIDGELVFSSLPNPARLRSELGNRLP